MSTDEDAIEEFLHVHYAQVVAAVSLVTGNRATAEEAVQEALIRAWERRDGYRIESLRAWVTATALNVARSWLRRFRSERRALARLGERPPVSSASGEAVEVRSALRSLPRRPREALVLHYYLGMSLAEIARTLKLSEGAVKNALHRGRRALAAMLSDAEEEADEHIER